MLSLQLSTLSVSWMPIHSSFFLISSPWVLKSGVEKIWVLPAILWCHLMTDPVQHAKRDPMNPKVFWCPLKPLAQKRVCRYVIFAHSSTNWHRHLQGTRADPDSELPSSPVWRPCYLHSTWWGTSPGQEAPSWEGLDICLQ